MLMLYASMMDAPVEKRKFEQIYLEYRQTMYYAAYRILGNVHDAEDAVHHAFLKIVNHLEKINESDCHKTRSYLVVITESAAIDIYRKRRRGKIFSFDELEVYATNDLGSDYEEKDAILRAIGRLSVNDSVILRLRYAHGNTNEEIANILNTSEQNVRKRLSRAKRRLQHFLEKEGVKL